MQGNKVKVINNRILIKNKRVNFISMNRNSIIERIYNDKQYIDYCYKVCNGKDIYKDLFQYVILYLLEMPAGKLEKIDRESDLRMYIARIIYINIHSPRSQFLKQYQSEDNKMPELIEEEGEDINLDKVKNEIKKEVLFCHQKNIYPASVKLLEIYSELGSYKAVADATKIKYKTVRRHIQGLTDKIKKAL